jgi:hypothetical protein
MLPPAPSEQALTAQIGPARTAHPSNASRLLMGFAGLILLGGAVLLLPFGTGQHIRGPSSDVGEQASIPAPLRAGRPHHQTAESQATKSQNSQLASSTAPETAAQAGPQSAPQSAPIEKLSQAAQSPSQPTPALSQPAPAEASVAAAAPIPDESEPLPVLVLPDTSSLASPRSVEPLVQLGPGVRRASAADYSGLYMGTQVPTQEIQGTRRVSTPQVGHVRAELLSGESYQGKLHSVGMGCVWIDLELGRMRLEARELRQLDKLPTLSKASAFEQAILGLPQVRVRTPGGSIDGWLVSRTEDKVTLVTASAQRLVLESREVEPLASPQVRIVGRKQP